MCQRALRRCPRPSRAEAPCQHAGPSASRGVHHRRRHEAICIVRREGVHSSKIGLQTAASPPPLITPANWIHPPPWVQVLVSQRRLRLLQFQARSLGRKAFRQPLNLSHGTRQWRVGTALSGDPGCQGRGPIAAAPTMHTQLCQLTLRDGTKRCLCATHWWVTAVFRRSATGPFRGSCLAASCAERRQRRGAGKDSRKVVIFPGQI